MSILPAMGQNDDVAQNRKASASFSFPDWVEKDEKALPKTSKKKSIHSCYWTQTVI